MNTLPPVDFVLKSQNSFNLVVAYEDFASALRAKHMHEVITCELGGDFHVNLSVWKFEILLLPRLRALAVRAAAEADMLIVSLSSPGDLHASVQVWLETGLAQRLNISAALVALTESCSSRTDASAPAQAMLREIARRHRLDYFSRLPDTPAQNDGDPDHEPSRQEASDTSESWIGGRAE